MKNINRLAFAFAALFWIFVFWAWLQSDEPLWDYAEYEKGRDHGYFRARPEIIIAAFNTKPVPRAVQRFKELQALACEGPVDIHKPGEYVQGTFMSHQYNDTAYWGIHQNVRQGVTDPYYTARGRCMHKRYRISEQYAGQENYVKYMSGELGDPIIAAHYTAFIRLSHSAVTHSDPANSPLCKAQVLAWTTPFPGRDYQSNRTIKQDMIRFNKRYLEEYEERCILNYNIEEDKLTDYGSRKPGDLQEAILYTCRKIYQKQEPGQANDVYPVTDLLLRFPNGDTHVWSMIFAPLDGIERWQEREQDWKLWEVNKDECPPLVKGYVERYEEYPVNSYDPNKMSLDRILDPREQQKSRGFYALGDDYFDRAGYLEKEFPHIVKNSLDIDIPPGSRRQAKPPNYE